MAERSKKLVIIDGKSVFYRGYYAMPNLSTKDGTPTGGVYGFAVMALEILKRIKPDYVCVAWDKPKTNIRKRLQLYPAYKAGRKPAPADFYEQIPLLHQLLEAFNWPLYELDDYEADDIMGALAKHAKLQNIETLLVTSDLDLLQVINDKVHVYVLKKGLSNIELFNPKSFEDKYGIEVEQFLDLKALKGDSSDNIPGVAGVGEKTAIKLLQQYGTIDGVYENIDLISPSKLADKLRDGKESAYLSKKLASIWSDAPVNLDLHEMDISKIDPQKVHTKLQELEFRTLAKQLPEVMKVPESEVGLNLGFGSTLPKVVELKNNQFDPSVSKDIIVHGYATGKHGKGTKIILLSPKKEELYILKPDYFKGKLNFIEDENISKIGFDIKSTIKMFYELGAKSFKGLKHDVLIGDFLIDSLQRDRSLTDLARRYLDYQGPDIDHIPLDEFVERAPIIIAIIWKLYDTQSKEIKQIPSIAKLAQDIEWPVVPVLAKMEYQGVRLDTDYLRRFSVELQDQISDLEQQIYGYADESFNIASPKQLASILFEKLNIPTTGVKKGQTGYSTAASELEKLRSLHPIIELISQYREVTKLVNTYVDVLPKMVDGNGRLHTTFSLTAVQTGRLSSFDPNLQNIPVRTELGKRIRTAFIADPGNILISADYSQFELRLAAVLANDQELIDLFNRDIDIHTATASQVYGREPEDVTKTMRRDAKVINFGILYGMSPHGLSAATGMTYTAAKEFIDKYFELRKPLLTYMNSLKDKAKTDGYVETLFGRRRLMPDIKSSNFAVRSAAERAAMNMPIQGTEADLMKLAMIKMDEYLMSKNAKLLLQVHDSVLVECPVEVADEVAVVIHQYNLYLFSLLM